MEPVPQDSACVRPAARDDEGLVKGAQTALPALCPPGFDLKAVIHVPHADPVRTRLAGRGCRRRRGGSLVLRA